MIHTNEKWQNVTEFRIAPPNEQRRGEIAGHSQCIASITTSVCVYTNHFFFYSRIFHLTVNGSLCCVVLKNTHTILKLLSKPLLWSTECETYLCTRNAIHTISLPSVVVVLAFLDYFLPSLLFFRFVLFLLLSFYFSVALSCLSVCVLRSHYFYYSAFSIINITAYTWHIKFLLRLTKTTAIISFFPSVCYVYDDDSHYYHYYVATMFVSIWCRSKE